MEKTKVWRIYTENKNKDRVVDLVKKYFSGFTVFEATGVWQSMGEKSLVLEIIHHDPLWKDFESLCQEIKELNNQKSVLLTCQVLLVGAI